MRDTPKAPFLQEIGNTDSNQVVCGIQAPPEVIWMCLPTSLKTYPPKQVALSQNGAFPDYYRWVWYMTYRYRWISLDWPLTQFGVFEHCALTTESFCIFGPALSSPARGPSSLAMAQRRIEVVFVLCDDLKLISGLRTPTAFNGQNHFFKIRRSKLLDEYYNSYLKKSVELPR